MRYFLILILVFLFTDSISQKKFTYPGATKESTFNIYHGDTIYDPYQWMENPEDPRLIDWLKDQKKITDKMEYKLGGKSDLAAQLYSMFVHTETKDLEGDKDDKATALETTKTLKYQFKFHSKHYGGKKLQYRKQGERRFKSLIDLDDFKNNRKDQIYVTEKIINEPLDIAVIIISHGGSDWREAYFYDLSTGTHLNDTLLFLRQSSDIIWDGNGIYYDRFDQPKEGRELLDKATGQALYYHKIGTSQSEDKMLFQNPDTTGTAIF